MITASISSRFDTLAENNCSAASQHKSPAVVDCEATYLSSSPINSFNLAKFLESLPLQEELSPSVWRSDPTTLAIAEIFPLEKVITSKLPSVQDGPVRTHPFRALLGRDLTQG